MRTALFTEADARRMVVRTAAWSGQRRQSPAAGAIGPDMPGRIGPPR